VTRLAAPFLALVLGLAAAFWVASCGSSDEGLLPGKTAADIVANLESVKQRAAEGDCSGAAADADTVQAQVEALGPEVDPDLKQNLLEGATQLTQLADQCVTESEATIPTETTETTTEADTTAPPETTTEADTTAPPETTPTQPPETTPTQPPETTPGPPPSSGGGGGGGGSNGSSGSGGIGPGAKLGTP
jgi:hypothetical protein